MNLYEYRNSGLPNPVVWLQSSIPDNAQNKCICFSFSLKSYWIVTCNVAVEYLFLMSMVIQPRVVLSICYHMRNLKAANSDVNWHIILKKKTNKQTPQKIISLSRQPDCLNNYSRCPLYGTTTTQIRYINKCSCWSHSFYQVIWKWLGLIDRCLWS